MFEFLHRHYVCCWIWSRVVVFHFINLNWMKRKRTNMRGIFATTHETDTKTMQTRCLTIENDVEIIFLLLFSNFEKWIGYKNALYTTFKFVGVSWHLLSLKLANCLATVWQKNSLLCIKFYFKSSMYETLSN